MSLLFGHKYPYTDYHELNLDWIIDKVAEIEKITRDLEEKYGSYDKLLDEAKAYTDEQVDIVRNELITLGNSISSLEVRLSNSINELNNKIKSGDDALQLDIDTKYLRNQQMIAQQWEDMKSYIEGQVFDIKVRNFFTGELVTIQSMFDYLANLHLEEAGTYNQVSGLNTYQHYADKIQTYEYVIINSGTFFNS